MTEKKSDEQRRHRGPKRMPIRIDLSGKRFGRVVAVKFIPKYTDGATRGRWAYQCDCGQAGVASSHDLRSGKVQSCGCLAYEHRREANVTHGGTRTPEWHSWRGALKRCHNPRQPGYRWYGARGVRVCARWRADFQNFLDDMGEKPAPQLSIDRKDNDGHYSCGKCEECASNGWPANCRWATPAEQTANRRVCAYLEAKNKKP